MQQPARTQDLLAYLSIVVNAARKYKGPGWQTYDAIFRQQAANDQHRKWADVNTSLWTTVFCNASPQDHCATCLSLDHTQTDCPEHLRSKRSGSPPRPRRPNPHSHRQPHLFAHVLIHKDAPLPPAPSDTSVLSATATTVAATATSSTDHAPIPACHEKTDDPPLLPEPFATARRMSGRTQIKDHITHTHPHHSDQSNDYDIFDSHLYLQLNQLPSITDDHLPNAYVCIPNHPTQEYRTTCFYFPEHLSGKYRYTHDLLMLDTFRCLPSTAVVPKELLLITTPLKPTSWADELKHMPDRQLVDYLLRGMKDGFRIGFDRRSTRLVSAKANMLSATINYEPVQAFLTKEVQASRVLGPFQAHHFPAVHVSRFGVIPKRSQPGKWRLILDLSAPSSHSVNDGIKPELCSMSYSSVDQAAKIIATLGRQARMAKIDIAHAYRNVPVHPEDRLLLGMRWQEAVYIDTVLPFGLRSAPKIFSALADTLEWILLRNQVPHIIHYLDDYFTAGAPGSDQCAQHLETITSICNKLGFPLAKDKVEGPSTVLTFLGILLDSSKMELRLPVEKLQLLKTLITTWLNRKTASKRELLSLIGHLSHATKVVPEGRTFLRRMIDLASTGHQLEHLIRLNVSFRSDLMWWNLFLDTWNGVSCLQSHFNAPPPPPQTTFCTQTLRGNGAAAHCASRSGFTFNGLIPGQHTPSPSRNYFP